MHCAFLIGGPGFQNFRWFLREGAVLEVKTRFLIGWIRHFGPSYYGCLLSCRFCDNQDGVADYSEEDWPSSTVTMTMSDHRKQLAAENYCRHNSPYVWCLPKNYNQEKHPFICESIVKKSHYLKEETLLNYTSSREEGQIPLSWFYQLLQYLCKRMKQNCIKTLDVLGTDQVGGQDRRSYTISMILY